MEAFRPVGTHLFIYLFCYLLCKSYQGTRKIMQKSTKNERKNIQKNKINTSHGAYTIVSTSDVGN